MRAIRFDGKSVAMVHVPDAHPGPGEALIHPLRVAIASPDLSVVGAQIPFVGIIGHEFVGVVDAVASAEHHAWVGKRVVGSVNIVCGKCDRCRGGLSNHCQSRLVLGLHNRDGCFAERFALPINNLVELPKAVDDDQAIFVNALACALHASTIIRFEGKPYVTVLGDGPIGLLAAQVISKLNASVRLLGKHPTKFALCERWGIKHRHISEVGRRMDQDIIVDCTGDVSGLELATQLVRPRGKIILKSTLAPIPSAPSPRTGPDLSIITNNEVEVIGARCGKLPDAVARLAKGEIDVRPLITGRTSLSDFTRAFKLARESESIKVLMD